MVFGKKNDSLELNIKGKPPIKFDIENTLDNFLQKVDQTDKMREYYNTLRSVNDLVEKGISINDANDERLWTDRSLLLYSCNKDIETIRKKLKGPFTRGGKKLDGFFSARKNKFQETIDMIENNILEYRDQKRKKAEETRRILEEKAQKDMELKQAEINKKIEEAKHAGDDRGVIILEEEKDLVQMPAVIVEEPGKTTRTDSGSLTEKKKYDFHISDMTSLLKFLLSKPEYMYLITLNETVFRQFVQRTENKIKIPGITVEVDTKLQSRLR